MNTMLAKYDDLFESMFKGFDALVEQSLSSLEVLPNPEVVVKDNVFEFSLPDFENKHVDVEVDGGYLTVSAEKITRGKKSGRRNVRSFLYSVSVGDQTLENKSFENGVLKVSLKNKEKE